MCLQNTPTKAPVKTLLSNYLHFVVGTYYHLFPDAEFSNFLIKSANLENNPLLLGDVEMDRHKAFMMLVP